jgi:hypothetical protein
LAEFCAAKAWENRLGLGANDWIFSTAVVSNEALLLSGRLSSKSVAIEAC